MTALRIRDKLFVVLVIPAALLGAYIYYWRIPHAEKVKTASEACAKLITPEKHAEEKAKLQKLVADTAAELEAEKKMNVPESKIAAGAGDTVAAREQAVLDVFRDAGLRVVSSEINNAEDGGARGGAVLRATALRPSPRGRRYSLEGSYSAVRRALELITERKCAVIAERLEMEGGEGEKWSLLLWL